MPCLRCLACDIVDPQSGRSCLDNVSFVVHPVNVFGVYLLPVPHPSVVEVDRLVEAAHSNIAPCPGVIRFLFMHAWCII